MKIKTYNKYGNPGLVQNGTHRYSITRQSLEALYKDLEDFIADIRDDEWITYKDSIQAVQTLIHHHINSHLTPDGTIPPLPRLGTNP